MAPWSPIRLRWSTRSSSAGRPQRATAAARLVAAASPRSLPASTSWFSLGRAGSTRATRAIPASPIGARPQHSCTSSAPTAGGRGPRPTAGSARATTASPRRAACASGGSRARAGAPARSRTRGRANFRARCPRVERIGDVARALRPVADLGGWPGKAVARLTGGTDPSRGRAHAARASAGRRGARRHRGRRVSETWFGTSALNDVTAGGAPNERARGARPSSLREREAQHVADAREDGQNCEVLGRRAPRRLRRAGNL